MLQRHLALALALLAAGGARAEVVGDSLFFNALAQNPFQAGPAVSWNKSYGIEFPISRTEVPAFRFPPSGPLYLEAGGRTEGVVGLGLDLGFNSGRLDLSLPMSASLTKPAAGEVRLGNSFRLALSSNAPSNGLFRFSDVISTSRAISTVGGVPLLGGGGAQLVRPGISTTFPSLSAALNASYTQLNSAYVQGCADAFITRVCTDIGTARLPSIGPLKQTLASFGPSGAYVLPGTSFQQGVDFGQPIPVFGPYGTLTPYYPTLATRGGMAGSNGPLTANGSQPILRLDLDLDQLISDYVLRPAALPPLRGPIGPATYTLLEATGSLFATVYQDFRYDPALSVRLDFDQPMRLAAGGGPFYSITMPAGSPLDLRPVNLLAGTVHVRPTYVLGGTLRSETGLGIGAGIDVKALRLQLGDLDTGFALSGRVEDDVPVLPLLTRSFTPVVPEIGGTAFTLDFASRFRNFDLTFQHVLDGGRFEYGLHAELPDGTVADRTIVGRLTDILDPSWEPVRGPFGEPLDIPPRRSIFLETDQPVGLQIGGEQIDLGSALCVFCPSFGFTHEEDPTVITLADGSTVLGSPPIDPVAPLPDGPSLVSDSTIGGYDPGGFTPFDQIPPQFQWLTAVPEPSALLLLATATGALLLARRRSLPRAALG